LAKPFAISQQAVSKHLAYLERARLVVKTKVGRENVCQLNPRPMRDAALWLQEYERFWSDAFDRLDDTLKTLHPTSAPKRRTQQ
jgi:DNA-binding transcriptional ArsR family regulator